jgi:hypothetical protein
MSKLSRSEIMISAMKNALTFQFISMHANNEDGDNYEIQNRPSFYRQEAQTSTQCYQAASLRVMLSEDIALKLMSLQLFNLIQEELLGYFTATRPVNLG